MTNARSRTLVCAVAAGLLATSGLAFAHDQKFEEMDIDGNGIISVAESDSAARQLYDRADQDNDGRVTAEELGTLYQELARESGKHHGGDAARAGEGARGAHGASHGGHGMDIERAMRELDSNNDGIVSRDEFMATARSKHEMSDIDRDGSVTRAEYDEAKRRAKDDPDARERTEVLGTGGR